MPRARVPPEAGLDIIDKKARGSRTTAALWR